MLALSAPCVPRYVSWHCSFLDIVSAEDGELKVWGWGEHGQLGLGNTDDALIPQIVILPGNLSKNEFTWRVICGSGFTFTVGEKSSNF